MAGRSSQADNRGSDLLSFLVSGKGRQFHTYRDAAYEAPASISASGGIISDFTVGTDVYRAHIFTSSGTFTVNNTATGEFNNNVDLLIVGAGGGGGGDNSGAGGGGGVLLKNDYVTAESRSYTITIGAGGGGGNGNDAGGGVGGATGGDTTFLDPSGPPSLPGLESLPKPPPNAVIVTGPDGSTNVEDSGVLGESPYALPRPTVATKVPGDTGIFSACATPPAPPPPPPSF
jgi:hypothetical protein